MGQVPALRQVEWSPRARRSGGMADAAVLNTAGGDPVRVRISPSAPRLPAVRRRSREAARQAWRRRCPPPWRERPRHRGPSGLLKAGSRSDRAYQAIPPDGHLPAPVRGRFGGTLDVCLQEPVAGHVSRARRCCWSACWSSAMDGCGCDALADAFGERIARQDREAYRSGGRIGRRGCSST